MPSLIKNILQQTNGTIHLLNILENSWNYIDNASEIIKVKWNFKKKVALETVFER